MVGKIVDKDWRAGNIIRRECSNVRMLSNVFTHLSLVHFVPKDKLVGDVREYSGDILLFCWCFVRSSIARNWIYCSMSCCLYCNSLFYFRDGREGRTFLFWFNSLGIYNLLSSFLLLLSCTLSSRAILRAIAYHQLFLLFQRYSFVYILSSAAIQH